MCCAFLTLSFVDVTRIDDIYRDVCRRLIYDKKMIGLKNAIIRDLGSTFRCSRHTMSDLKISIDWKFCVDV